MQVRGTADADPRFQESKLSGDQIGSLLGLLPPSYRGRFRIIWEVIALFEEMAFLKEVALLRGTISILAPSSAVDVQLWCATFGG